MTDSSGTQPGVIPLRPLAMGEIFQGTLATLRRHAPLVFGASAVVAVLSAVLNYAVNTWVLDPPRRVVIDQMASPERQADQAWQAIAESLPSLGVASLIGMLTQAFLGGFLMVVVGKAVLGASCTFGQAWEELKPRLLPLLGLTVIVTVITSIGFFLFVIPGIWLYALLALATPALILERGTIGAAISRSTALVRGSWWRVFGVLAVATLLTFVVGYVIQLPFGQPGTLVAEIGGALAQAITVPFASGVTALLYIDQRIRRENLGAELARAAGET